MAGIFEGRVGSLGREMCMAGDGMGNVEGVVEGGEILAGDGMRDVEGVVEGKKQKLLAGSWCGQNFLAWNVAVFFC